MPARSPTKSFTYTLLGAGPNKAHPYIELPFDSVAFFGARARVPVVVTIHGVAMSMSLAPMGGRHVLGFRRELAEKARIRVGDTVRVTIAKDDAPRTVTAPPELAEALRRNAAAKRAWSALAYSHQREHAEAILAAKKPETRARRVEKTLAMLVSTGKPARPAPSTKPLAERLRLAPHATVALLAAPKGFSLGTKTTASPKRADAVLAFAASRAALTALLPKVVSVAGSTPLWIAYPKTTSGVKTDLTRDVGWEAVERAGLRAVTQVAVDDTWSALRFRPARGAAATTKARAAAKPGAGARARRSRSRSS
ncbi:MAG: DUF1905 domain-containing protein [Labilithrix sp.]|nr:DUF1905 domain-containing protein [Labilithrix sp.]